MFQLWILDDSRANCEMIERSVPDRVRSVVNVRPFEDAREFLAAFERSLRSPLEPPPDFIVLDFFLGCMYGSEVLDRVRQSCANRTLALPVIIAFSSMPEASDSMVERGADFALRKLNCRPTSPPIEDTFRSREAIEYLRIHRRPMARDLDK